MYVHTAVFRGTLETVVPASSELTIITLSFTVDFDVPLLPVGSLKSKDL